MDYFCIFLSNDQPLDLSCHQELLSIIPILISFEIDSILTRNPSNMVVKEVVFSFEGNMVLGLDGFPMFFFLTSWDIFSKDVIATAKEFFGSHYLLRELNVTFIVLIQKKVGIESCQDFHLISLCNSMYNILSKILVLNVLNSSCLI